VRESDGLRAGAVHLRSTDPASIGLARRGAWLPRGSVVILLVAGTSRDASVNSQSGPRGPTGDSSASDVIVVTIAPPSRLSRSAGGTSVSRLRAPLPRRSLPPGHLARQATIPATRAPLGHTCQPRQTCRHEVSTATPRRTRLHACALAVALAARQRRFLSPNPALRSMLVPMGRSSRYTTYAITASAQATR